MNYINGVISNDPLVQSIDAQIKKVKRNEDERVSYMTYMAHIRDAKREGIAIGEKRGVANNRNNTAMAMLSDSVPASFISKYTKLSIDDLHALAMKNNLPFVDN